MEKVYGSTCNIRYGVVLLQHHDMRLTSNEGQNVHSDDLIPIPLSIPIMTSGVRPWAVTSPSTPWHCQHRIDVVRRRSHPGSVPQYDGKPVVVHESHHDENAIHWWRVQLPTVQVSICGVFAIVVAMLDGGDAAIIAKHRVCEGRCRVHVGSSTQFSHWYDADREWCGQWLRQFGSDCAKAPPWCTHSASVTPHVAVQKAANGALIPCLGQISTGTGQCVCAQEIDLLGSHLRTGLRMGVLNTKLHLEILHQEYIAKQY